MVTLTTLVDNHASANSGLESEHGFSCFVEAGSVRILFDTGKSDAFMRNAQSLGVDLSRINHIVISHGHYDHGGGLLPLLERYSYQSLSLWTGKGFEYPKYADEAGGMRFLGTQFNTSNINDHGIMWHTVCGDTVMIHPGIWLIGNFDQIHPIEKPNPRFVLDRGSGKVLDTFADEIALVVDTPKGLLLLVGCSHPGILNIVDSVRSRFSKPIYALLGGIHLYDASRERRDAVVKDLSERSIPRLGVSHCTGDEAEALLAQACPGYFQNMVGTVTTIE